MSASARAEVAPLLRWTEAPCSRAGAVDLTLYVNGNYFGVVCTCTERTGQLDGWMRAVIPGRGQHNFRTREECVAFMEISALGGERGRA